MQTTVDRTKHWLHNCVHLPAYDKYALNTLAEWGVLRLVRGAGWSDSSFQFSWKRSLTWYMWFPCSRMATSAGVGAQSAVARSWMINSGVVP